MPFDTHPFHFDTNRRAAAGWTLSHTSALLSLHLTYADLGIRAAFRSVLTADVQKSHQNVRWITARS
jgi:hypothetical protein